MKDKLKWLNEISPYLESNILDSIKKIPISVLNNVSEIRLRLYGAISLTNHNKNIILCDDNKKQICLDAEQLNNVFVKLCDGAVYKYENQIRNGYITIKGGHRVGFCGTAVYNKNNIITVKDISSITFRISREIKNAAREVIGNIIDNNRINSALIVSEPCGGKTTILSDLSRLISNYGKRCAVIDERGEICAVFNGKPHKNVGDLTDVLNGYNKGEGMMIALRCLSPEVIICDEIGSKQDVDSMLEAMNAGVPVIATAHAHSEDDLISRPQIERLIDSGAIDKVLFLKGSANPGVVKKVITVNRYDEDNWNSDDHN